MFNYIDRYVVPPLFESLRNDPVMGHPSDAQVRRRSINPDYVLDAMAA
jgi:hypothetical protein